MVGFSSSSLPVMDLKKVTFTDQFLSSPRRKVVSPFGMGVILSFIVLTVVLFYVSFKGPIFNPVVHGLNGFSSHSNSSFLSWPFSSPFSSPRNSTAGRDNGYIGTNVVVNETLAANSEGSGKSLDFVGSDGKDKVSGGAHVANEFKNGSFGDVGVGKGDGNGSESVKNSILVNGSGKGVELEKAHIGDSVENVKNESVGGNGDLRSHRSYKDCDIFNGRWVRDDSKPYYPPGSCPFIDRDFDCHRNGRPDGEFVKWRWQPYECDIPRLNVTDFLERLRGKKLVFVGDSLNRNMWESLVCLLRHGVADKKKVYEISGRHEFKKKGFYAFRFEDYNCTIDFVSSPFLVKESSFNGKKGSFETLRLDLMDKTTSMYHDADVLIFNTGHWWTHEKTSRGEDYYQEGNYVHPRLKVLEAFKRAIATWARWVDKNIDGNKAYVIFRGYSATHFRGGPWNSGGQCHKETEPIFNETYLTKYPSKMKLLEYVLKDMKTPVTYLNISRLTDYRKDGHPSIYRPDYQSAQRQEVHAQDCSHWCLPGVPDTWNELLYVSLLKSGRGSWKN